jgi:nodulation protein E
MNDPIVIAGIGILSPLGIGMEETLAALREGDSAILPCARFLPPEGVSPLAGEVPEFQVEAFGVSPKTYLDRASELLLAAAGQALQRAGLAAAASRSPERAGLLVGTAWGCLETQAAFFADYAQKGPRLVKPLLFPHAYFNTAISLVAVEWSLRGPHQAFASGRAASGQALVEARDLLRDGVADVALAGGCEALGPTRMRAMAGSGLAPGEAGVMLALERRSRAATRGAPVLATILGAALGTDSPVRAGDGVAAAIRAALAEAARKPAELACVCASANGCADVDEREAEGMRQVFGGSPPPMAPSFAALCGDTAGATAALHTALAIGIRANGFVPPSRAPTRVQTPATPLRPGPLLVLATDPTGSTAALVLE